MRGAGFSAGRRRKRLRHSTGKRVLFWREDFGAVFPDASPLVAGLAVVRLPVRLESAICEVGLEPAIVLVEDSASQVQPCLARLPFFVSD